MTLETKVIDELEEMLWFLVTHFFNESPDSYLDDNALIEDGIMYNSAYSKLVYDLENIQISTIILDEEYFFTVHKKNLIGYSLGEKVYLNIHYTEDTFSTHKQIYVRGDWEEEIKKEYEIRLAELEENQ